jgi:hypothetical protein
MIIWRNIRRFGSGNYPFGDVLLMEILDMYTSQFFAPVTFRNLAAMSASREHKAKPEFFRFMKLDGISIPNDQIDR